MFSTSNYAYEHCPKRCKNPEHGEKITTVLLKSAIPDDRIAAYIGKTCRNFVHVLDHQGQSALHVAAAAPKYVLVEWLLNNGADVNLVDKQFGQTALHRAIRYGHFDIVMLLLNYGATFDVNDFKQKSPVQYCCKPKNYVDEQSNIKEKNSLKEILVWGNNRNYNLGLENKEGKQCPHQLDCFAKQNLAIRSASISCYHCLYLDEKGEVHAVGLGDGGRLGINSEVTLVLPKKIQIPTKHKNECAVSVSAAKNHSIVLTSEDRIFTCGLNNYGQLGQANCCDKSLILREVEIGEKDVRGIIARDFYSLAYTSNDIFVWGLNVGQFGTPTIEEKVMKPIKVTTSSQPIACVDASNAVIACVTRSGLILLFAKSKVKTLKKPIIHETIKHIAISGGDITSACVPEKSRTSEPIKLIVLTGNDSIFLWSNDEQKYVRCQLKQPISISRIQWCGQHLLVQSSDGCLYRGQLTKHSIDASNVRNPNKEFIEQKSSRRQEICERSECEISLTRISNIDRVTDVWSDQRGECFVVLQESSKRYLSMPVLPDDPITFKSLLTESTEFDALHDIVFHVEDELFPAHKYIVFSRAEGLRDIVKKSNDKHIYLNYEGLTAKMFELILKYIYENHTLSMTDIEDVETSFDPYSGLSNLDIYTLFREYMGKFGVSKYFDRMMNPAKDRDSALRFNRLSYPELYDVTIECAASAKIQAHRCVLSTRLEYFNLMFKWSESTKNTINLSTVPKEYMEPIINFLYNNDANAIRKQQYTDAHLYHLMEICDQFFVTRLKNIIEMIMIEKMIPRKCGDMYEFAVTFNCELLEGAALDYICQNMGRLLENHCLEHLQLDTLEKISEYYRQMFHLNSPDLRVTTLYDEYITDEMVVSFAEDFQIDLTSKLPTLDAKHNKSRKSDKSTNDRRNYEKEAINLVKNLSLESNTNGNVKKPVENVIIGEAEAIAKTINDEVTKWVKVTDKKDTKKKTVLAALKSNDILKSECKERDNFISLKNTNQSNTSQSDLDQSFSSMLNSSIESTSDKNSSFSLSLGDFTPNKGVKMSQKQRKRQMSQGESSIQSSDTPKPITKSGAWTTSTPTTMNDALEQPNAWKITSPQTQPKSTSPAKSQPINITSPSTSHSTFNDSFFSQSPSSSLHSSSLKSPRPKSGSGSFSKILEEERKQKEYYNKLKTKSLLLTQIEETAISELKKFYNVDDLFDENIEIDRVRHMTAAVNFAEWKHN